MKSQLTWSYALFMSNFRTSNWRVPNLYLLLTRISSCEIRILSSIWRPDTNVFWKLSISLGRRGCILLTIQLKIHLYKTLQRLMGRRLLTSYGGSHLGISTNRDGFHSLRRWHVEKNLVTAWITWMSIEGQYNLKNFAGNPSKPGDSSLWISNMASWILLSENGAPERGWVTLRNEWKVKLSKNKADIFSVAGYYHPRPKPTLDRFVWSGWWSFVLSLGDYPPMFPRNHAT